MHFCKSDFASLKSRMSHAFIAFCVLWAKKCKMLVLIIFGFGGSGQNGQRNNKGNPDMMELSKWKRKLASNNVYSHIPV